MMKNKMESKPKQTSPGASAQDVISLLAFPMAPGDDSSQQFAAPFTTTRTRAPKNMTALLTNAVKSATRFQFTGLCDKCVR